MASRHPGCRICSGPHTERVRGRRRAKSCVLISGVIAALHRCVSLPLPLPRKKSVVCASPGASRTISPSPSPTALPSAAPVSVSESVIIRLFIPASSSAKGLLVQVYRPFDRVTTLASESIGFSACTAVAGGQSCAIALNPSPGPDDFVFTAYNAAPTAGGSFTGAQVVGTGVTRAGVPSSGSVRVNLAIGGGTAQLAMWLSPTTLDATTPSQVLALVDARDARGRSIITSHYTDLSGGEPQAITLSASSPHFAFSNTTTSAPATSGVAAAFDGSLTSGYQVTFTASAGSISANATLAATAPQFSASANGLGSAAFPQSVVSDPNNNTIWITDAQQPNNAIDYLSAAAGSTVTAIPLPPNSVPDKSSLTRYTATCGLSKTKTNWPKLIRIHTTFQSIRYR